MRTNQNFIPAVGTTQAPKNLRRKMAVIGSGAVSAVSAIPAMALDVAAVTGEISGSKADLESVGVAIIGIAVVVMIIFMIRRLLR